MSQQSRQQQMPRFTSLEGTSVPDLDVQATPDGERVNLYKDSGVSILVIQPGSSAPFETVDGWLNELKKTLGAPGCSLELQHCKDNFVDLSELGIKLFAMSSQSLDELKAVKECFNLPFELLSDNSLIFLEALNLRPLQYPNYDLDGARAGHPRITLVIENGMIRKAIIADWNQENGIQTGIDQAVKEAKRLKGAA